MSKKILVVDDEPFVLRSLTFVLGKHGYETVSAKDGREALKLIEEEKPDLVFLDVMMPYLNGYEVCRKIRQDPRNDNLYIIMLTAKGQERDRKKGLTVGANEFMVKHFSPSTVMQRVKEILDS